VVVLTGHFHPHVGGVERYTRELWQRMTALGWQVTVVTSNTDAAAERERLYGLEVVRLPVFKIVHDRLPIFRLSPALVRLLRTVDGARGDLVVTNTRFFPSSVLGALLARRWGVPLVHIDHGSSHIPIPGKLANALGERWDHAVGGWVLGQAARCYGVSQAVSDFLAHLGRAGAGVLYNGVDAAEFAPRPSEARRTLGIGPDETMLLYVGRLIADKGIQVLLDAYRRLPRREGLHLVVAGDGHMKAAVEAQVAGDASVHLLGRLAPHQVRELLWAADVFVHPSRYPEGLPTAVLEAGAAGLAVVATPMGGTPEIIPDPEHGLIVPDGDVEALSGAIAALGADPARRRRLGQRLRARVGEKFDWDRIAAVADRELSALLAPAASS
jgi:glycosyltransferase involved in cell wall biosynthesis